MRTTPGFDAAIWVWRDDFHKGKFWVRVWMNGRVDWLEGGFKSGRQAMNAGKDRVDSYY